eukprot:TRINITY_DN5569_c0_g4_i1.p1 TRINITY_DN5569_c0_g4~~TRINITY_DN5569_c0_g4_i1.p1  ORF type:complete len:211 (+),score=63.54 TRINITY_DN5569_c0_g4_i1:90-722(+)
MTLPNIKRDYDYMFKLVLIGDSGVGKSCLLLRFVDDKFEHSRMGTIGVDFRFRTVTIADSTIKLQIWDTAGQERFRTIRSAYYRGADGIILVYDVTSRASFDHIDTWLQEVSRFIDDSPFKLLIGSRCDLVNERVVSTEEGKALAQRLGVEFFETSAKEGLRVHDSFLALAGQLLQARQAQTPAEEDMDNVDLANPAGPARGQNPCCKSS